MTVAPSSATTPLATMRNVASAVLACSRWVAWNTKWGSANVEYAIPAVTTSAARGTMNAAISTAAMPSVAPPKSRA